jgi:hypothetical protein
LTGREVDAALALHRRSGIGGSKITISSQKEMYDLIDEASVVLTSVSSFTQSKYLAKDFPVPKIKYPRAIQEPDT